MHHPIYIRLGHRILGDFRLVFVSIFYNLSMFYKRHNPNIFPLWLLVLLTVFLIVINTEDRIENSCGEYVKYFFIYSCVLKLCKEYKSVVPVSMF